MCTSPQFLATPLKLAIADRYREVAENTKIGIRTILSITSRLKSVNSQIGRVTIDVVIHSILQKDRTEMIAEFCAVSTLSIVAA